MKNPVGSLALLLLCAAGSVLMLDRDAGAVPGPPRLPNFKVPQASAPQAVRRIQPMIPTVVANGYGLLKHNISDIINHHPSNSSSGSMWDGQGPLPGAFNPPWHFADSNFDPLFRTAYWNPADGFTNVADAPWNQGLAGRYGMGRAIFNRGKLYVGKPNFTGLLPVWDPTSKPAAQPAANAPSSRAL